MLIVSDGWQLLAPGCWFSASRSGCWRARRYTFGTDCRRKGVMVPLQSFSSGVLAEIVRRQPASKERTNFAWQLAVGQVLARATTVELCDRVLTVRAVDKRWIQEINRGGGSVITKMQNILGSDQVTRIVTRAAGQP